MSQIGNYYPGNNHYGYRQQQYNQGQYQQNSTDIRTGGGNHFWRERGSNPFHSQGTHGYGLNLNQRPGHQRGQDGVLVFDTNKDGKYDNKDVQGSNDIMKAATGDFDFNKDGKVDFMEKLRGQALRQQFTKMDTNRDGRLDTNEMNNAGGKVWIDSSGGGGVGQNELHSVYNVPGQDRFGRQGSQRLDFVDPFAQTSHTSPNNPRWGGGGCNCYDYGGGGGNWGGGGQFGGGGWGGGGQFGGGGWGGGGQFGGWNNGGRWS